MASAASFSDDSLQPAVRGFLHSPASPNGNAIVLTHGAGADCNTSLLVAVSEAFAAEGYLVLRCDLPFRQERSGPPHPGIAARDRAGLRNAVSILRNRVAGQIFLGGHSYGGRQATMLCADEPELVSGLLLLSYPLHPVGKP
jgi:predicted alpha/beta-hydrolase family hydrolase